MTPAQRREHKRLQRLVRVRQATLQQTYRCLQLDAMAAKDNGRKADAGGSEPGCRRIPDAAE